MAPFFDQKEYKEGFVILKKVYYTLHKENIILPNIDLTYKTDVTSDHTLYYLKKLFKIGIKGIISFWAKKIYVSHSVLDNVFINNIYDFLSTYLAYGIAIFVIVSFVVVPFIGA